MLPRKEGYPQSRSELIASTGNMSSGWQPVRFPEYHGDPVKFPHEQWRMYKLSLELAHQALDRTPSDRAKKAQLLAGLRNPARRVLEVTPELLKEEKTYQEVVKFLDDKFDRQSSRPLIDISKVVQQPGESVFNFAARLKEAAQIMLTEQPGVMGLKIDIVDEAQPGGPGENMEITPTVKVERVELREGSSESRKLVEDVQKDMVDKFLLPHFINGLRDEFRLAVAREKPKGFEAAIRSAEEYEQYIDIYGGSLRDDQYAHANIAMTAHVSGTVAEAAGHLKELNSSPVEDQGEQFRRKSSEVICWYCGKKGHIERECRTRQQKQYMPHERKGSQYFQPRSNQANIPRDESRERMEQRSKSGPNRRAVHFSQMSKNGERQPNKPFRLKNKKHQQQVMACLWDEEDFQ